MTSSENYQALVQQLDSAVLNRAKLPKFPQLSLADAYGVQTAFTVIAEGGLAGFKAGITTPNLQAYFGLDGPVLGRLFNRGRLEKNCILPYIAGVNLECEMGIIIDKNGKPKAMAPAIEIVYIDLAEPADMNAANLVACNLGADRFIVGDLVPWQDDFETAEVSLARDGEVINQAALTEAIGGPAPALKWMIEQAQTLDLLLEDDMLLMTGTCGGVVPGERGDYVADYGVLGSIAFTVS